MFYYYNGWEYWGVKIRDKIIREEKVYIKEKIFVRRFEKEK